MWSSSKIEDVSQTCFVLDVVQLKKCRRLAELLRFGCCQVQKLQKSRRILSSKIEDVSQNSFVFKRADRPVDRQTDRQRERDRQIDRQIDRWID